MKYIILTIVGWAATLLTTLVFILLKVTSVIAWPLVWVLCPLWIFGAFYIIGTATFAIWAFKKLRNFSIFNF